MTITLFTATNSHKSAKAM